MRYILLFISTMEKLGANVEDSSLNMNREYSTPFRASDCENIVTNV